MKKIFLLSPLAQDAETKKYCFGSCKKITCGGIDFMDAPWFPCYEEKCLNLERQQSFGKTNIDGENMEIIVRKLK
jgi:hypothetical protein